MKATEIIGKTFKIILWIILGILLVPCAVLAILYSPWGQDIVRERVIPAINSDALRIELDDFSLKFPLRIGVSGLTVYTDRQEMTHVGSLDADIRLLPLLGGRAELTFARLDSARFAIGGPDSAMYMTIRADSLGLRDASVLLTDMHIDLPEGGIRGGRVNMTLNPDTTASDTTASQPSDMRIKIGRLALDDFTYTMRMLPTIDSLGSNIGHGELRGGLIDLKTQKVALESFGGSGLAVSYIAPDSATVASTPVIPDSPATPAAAPWTVTIDSLRFDKSKALYTTRGVTPLPGLDFGYIAVDSLDLAITDFYNQATVVKIPLKVSGTERCGVALTASGTLAIDSTALYFNRFQVETSRGTALSFEGKLGSGDLMTDPGLPLALRVDGSISPADGRLMFPAFTPYLATIPRDNRLKIGIDLNGTAGDIDVRRLDLTVNTVAKFSLSGNVRNAFNPDKIGGKVKITGDLIDVNPLVASILDPATAKTLRFPHTRFEGNIDMAAGDISGRLLGITDGGDINLEGDWHGRGPDYGAKLSLNNFPVGAFMPSAGVGRVTAALDIDGHGFNPFSPGMALSAKAHVVSATYDKYTYRDITADVHLDKGDADIEVVSHDPNAQAFLSAHGNLAGSTYIWEAELDGAHIDLNKLGLSPEEATVEANLTAEMELTPKPRKLAAKLTLNSLSYTDRLGTTELDNVVARLNANDSATNVNIHNRDLVAYMSSQASVDTLMARFDAVSAVIADQMTRRDIDVLALQRALPQFVLDLDAGPDNALTDLLSESRMGWNNLTVSASNDSTMQMNARILELQSGEMRLDTVTVNMAQFGPSMILSGRVDNRPGTFDQWAHVRMDAFLNHNRLGIQLAQRDIQGQEGYKLGLRAELADSTASVHVSPANPTIAYKQWTVNPDNFITWNFNHKHLDANLRMEGNGSSLALFTKHIPGQDEHQEALTLSLKDIHLSDWISINPFAPPMKGDLNAEVQVSGDATNLNGDGTLSLNDFYYNRQKVGDIGADLKVNTDGRGRIRADVGLSVNGIRTITVAGALNDSTAGSPLALDFSMIHFPLDAVNPFLPDGVGRLRGMLNGSMNITGSGGDPKIDGWLQFDSTAMKVDMTGTWYPFSDVRIPVEQNVVKFAGFGINGVNGNPLTVDGAVDLRSMSNPGIDLVLRAKEFQICNTNRAARGADLYGKGFITLNTTVRGNMDYMAVDAALTVLSGTNLTYVMPEAVNAITQQANGDMVKFVNFADTAAVQAADSVAVQQMALQLNAELTVQNGSAISVDLSTDGKNKVRLQPNGSIDFTMAPFSEPRVTGRLNIPKGFVRYSPPFMSEKNFEFEDDSYIAFTGDMLNPTLNIHARDVIKANVTQSGQNSRLVNFNVLLAVTGTLNVMKVSFDLTTEDDATVANELQSMSADQRASAAMNMLVTNVYSGPNTTGTANSGNMLYSFLASQLNTWAAQNIRGVDLTFGIDQYDKTYNGSTSQTTSYSYQVSKSLFSDRFKIVVGGNYSTDANADENFSQNLIKDISFEYFLNKAQTMYVRIFRHTGYESILEGEITQTGVGFVYKRKLTNLKRLFNFLRPKRRKAPRPAEAVQEPAKTAVPNDSI